MEQNLTDRWTKKDVVRWVAGLMAGWLAGLVMVGFTILVNKVLGNDPLYVIKLASSAWLDGPATEFATGGGTLAVGGITLLAIFGFLGFIYAHFTGTNHLPSLLGVGLAWGAFGWIFINNLFMQSFRSVYINEAPKGWAFISWLVFGVALTSVAFFDKTLRKSRA